MTAHSVPSSAKSAAHERAREPVVAREEELAARGRRPHAEVARVEADEAAADGPARRRVVHRDARGALAGALIVSEDDEVLVVLQNGKVVRSAVAEVPAKGRDTMGVVFARPDDDDRIIAIARNSERHLVDPDADTATEADTDNAAPAATATEAGKDHSS